MNSKFIEISILILSIVLLSKQSFQSMQSDALGEQFYYMAGVVEFRPEVAGTIDALSNHLQAYKEIIGSPEAEDVDIIVFPEGTLNNDFQLSYVPSKKDNIVPCLLSEEENIYADFLIELSCAARTFKKYLVINLMEKEICWINSHDPRQCSRNGLNIFNTNVVFDRDGRVISRYRKTHVYVKNRNTTYEQEYGVFETDFGVRFGHFICFDILFYTPAEELVERFGITDIIFTSKFYSELPFLTAVQLQLGWSWGNNVNLLAAGASYPINGSTGSGIYAGESGILVSTMVTGNVGERKLYKAKVPKRNMNISLPILASSTLIEDNLPKHLRLLKDPQIENFNSILLNFQQQSDIERETLCHGDFCCQFNISASTMNSSLPNYYYYRLGVFDGKRTYEKKEWSNIRICSLYACVTEAISSCGELSITNNLKSSVIFRNISIKGLFKKSKHLLIMPNSLENNLLPIQATKVNWSKTLQGDSYEVFYQLKSESDNLLTFGIYANYYEGSAAAGMHVSYLRKPWKLVKIFHFLIMVLNQKRNIFN
uniref:CN hydrolase domain-containing protein n=1 Tax=Glossina brevipalpis TaxID=37001 RepID=A0A1A9WT10_9MUSC